MVKFTNTDSKFIIFVLKWLREICDVPEDKIRLHLRVHRDIDRKKSEKYWSELTKIPRERFYRTTVKISASNGRRHNKLNKGIASVIICDTKLFYRIRGWIEGLTANIGL